MAEVEGLPVAERPEDHPINVSWKEATEFCKWLNKTEWNTYRLPTDHEWSLAVGIGEREDPKFSPESKSAKFPGVYPWGSTWPPPKGAGNYSDQSRKAKAPSSSAMEQRYIDGYDDGFPATAPVMSFKPNALGLYDMGGNVWEWVEDWFDEAKTDRVLRGCSWNSYTDGGEDYLRSSNRGARSPAGRYGVHGFRVVLEASGNP